MFESVLWLLCSVASGVVLGGMIIGSLHYRMEKEWKEFEKHMRKMNGE